MSPSRPSMRLVRSLFLAVVCLPVGLVVGCLSGGATPQPEPLVVQSSLAIGDAALERFLQARVKIKWRTGTTDSMYVIAGPATPNQKWTIGQTPVSIPDHHLNTEVVVLDVASGTATIVVLQRNSHFGKNLMTVDCRVLRLDVVPIAP